MKVRRKPLVFDAFEYQEQDFCFFPQWASEAGVFVKYYKDNKLEKLCVKTLEGEMLVSIGDYILRGVKGEIWPVKPDIFEATYDVLEETEG